MAEIIKSAAAKAPGLQAPKLLKKESYEALSEATAILDGAHAQAARILAAAERQRDELFAQARRDGEAEGVRRYLEAIAEVAAKVEAFHRAAEPELVKLAAGVARKIAGGELASSPDAMARMVRQALVGLRQARRVVIQTHPAQVETLRERVPALDLSSAAEVQVLGNASLSEGDCLMETELGMVDARLETQVELIERALTRRPL